MNKREHEERERFFDVLATQTGKDRQLCEFFGMKLIRLAKKAQRYSEACCMRETSKREDRQDDERDAKATKIALELGCKGLRIQGDPRGAPYGVLFHDTSVGNSWGGPECGWVVPD